MKFTLLTTALLTLTLTPLSVLADCAPTPTGVVLRKCVPLYGDMPEGDVWHIQDLFCNSDCHKAGYNGGGCDRASEQCFCS